MQTVETSNVLTRDDTFFGVCQALGEDFGFSPNYLRVVFGVGLLWNPLAMVAAYAAAGVVVAASRWLVPNPKAPKAVEASEPVATEIAEATAAAVQPVDEQAEALSLAA